MCANKVIFIPLRKHNKMFIYVTYNEHLHVCLYMQSNNEHLTYLSLRNIPEIISKVV